MSGYPLLIFVLCVTLGAAVLWLILRLLVMWVTLD